MATIFKTPKKEKAPATGKRVPVIGSDGKPVMLPKWRTVVVDHKGNRKTITLSSNKQQAQKQADMIEQREREIKMGVRAVPTPQDKNGASGFRRDGPKEIQAAPGNSEVHFLSAFHITIL